MNLKFIRLIDTILKQHSEFAQYWMNEFSLTCSSRLAKVGILLVNARKCSLYRSTPEKSDDRYELLQELLGTCAVNFLCCLDYDQYYPIPKENKEKFGELKQQLIGNLNQLRKFDIWDDFVEWAVLHDLAQLVNVAEECFNKLITHS